MLQKIPLTNILGKNYSSYDIVFLLDTRRHCSVIIHKPIDVHNTFHLMLQLCSMNYFMVLVCLSLTTKRKQVHKILHCFEFGVYFPLFLKPIFTLFQ